MTTAAPPSPFRAAIEAHDLDATMRSCSPDVVLHSPISRWASIAGQDQVREVLSAVLDVVGEFRYLDEVANDEVRIFRIEGTAGGQPFEETMWTRLDAEGLVHEIRVYIRPLAGLTAFTAALAPRLGRRRGRLQALALHAMTRPVAFLTRSGDRPAARLALGR